MTVLRFVFDSYLTWQKHIDVPPNASAEYHSDLVNYLNTISAQSAPVLLLGDFNWSTLAGSSTALNNLCEFIFESNLVQLVDSPTHDPRLWKHPGFGFNQ